MSGISSGASGLNRAIAGYTEKTQINLCLLCKGAWLQIGESGSATHIYCWLRVKRIGLRRLAACAQKRSLRTFLTRAGISSTSFARSAVCSFDRGQQGLTQRALNLSVALWCSLFSLILPIGRGIFVDCRDVYVSEYPPSPSVFFKNLFFKVLALISFSLEFEFYPP